jgi:demethylmenaquinone methyltransferase/2-methoxy-6-polyprenyl-1,4-benzoquinol methylase
VLEIGFGPGHLLVTMAGEGLRPVGVDHSPQMLRLARRNLRGQRVPLLRGDGLALPFRPGAFDSVVLTFPAPYVRHAGAEIRRVLAPGGRLVIADGARPGAFGLGAAFLAWAQRQPDQPRLGYEDDLRRAGFRVTTQARAVGRSAVLVLAAEPES